MIIDETDVKSFKIIWILDSLDRPVKLVRPQLFDDAFTPYIEKIEKMYVKER